MTAAALLGLALLLLLFWDVYTTVFVPRGPAGPIAGRLYDWSWIVWHRLVGHATRNARRRLARLGPLLIPLTVIVWAFTLLVAFTLLLLPWARTFQVDDTVAFPAWFNALYISAYSITTLGIGDVTPTGMIARLVMVFAAASGFVLITVAVTYLLAVYGALDRMTALAYEIHRFVGRNDAQTPADLVATALTTDGSSELNSWLSSTATALSEVVQSEDEFPLLHYFHQPDERALPIALTDLGEVVTILRTMVSPLAYPALAEGIITGGTERIVRGYFATLARRFETNSLPPGELEDARRGAFEHAWRVLQRKNIPLRDPNEAWHRYEQTRRHWDAPSARTRTRFGYPTRQEWRREESVVNFEG
ncbi:potassium channel family protein [Deinococcus yavapaiensis]|uniref:Ion channel n=1 Tax=Deinococcus yavapaiensis KR-236 TaxID=694435 RepID=A0A318SHC8_9DEIO|nr:potassium channel family protein [Deinococcus yavapaiensis]PYE56535.1 ion channel [Deinococcus yavapaiensis KR-236]